MEYKILSRKTCELYAKQKHKKTSAIISIRSSFDNVYPDLPCNDDNNINTSSLSLE